MSLCFEVEHHCLQKLHVHVQHVYIHVCIHIWPPLWKEVGLTVLLLSCILYTYMYMYNTSIHVHVGMPMDGPITNGGEGVGPGFYRGGQRQTNASSPFSSQSPFPPGQLIVQASLIM